MDHASLFTIHDPLGIVVRTLTVYLFLLVGLRLAGKRQLGQMTVFDLVVILVLSNAVQNAMVGPDSSLDGGLLAATVLLVANFGMSWARTRWPNLARWLGGHSTDIIRDGRFVAEALARENLSEEEVAMAMREHGVEDLKQVHRAVLETDGSISVVVTNDAPKAQRRRHVRFLKKSS